MSMAPIANRRQRRPLLPCAGADLQSVPISISAVIRITYNIIFIYGTDYGADLQSVPIPVSGIQNQPSLSLADTGGVVV